MKFTWSAAKLAKLALLADRSDLFPDFFVKLIDIKSPLAQKSN